jgi:hypothetical protein
MILRRFIAHFRKQELTAVVGGYRQRADLRSCGLTEGRSAAAR